MNSRNNRYSIVIALACLVIVLVMIAVGVMTAPPCSSAAC